jgi:hypothetical protein
MNLNAPIYLLIFALRVYILIACCCVCINVPSGVHKRKRVSLFRPHTPLPSGDFSLSVEGISTDLISFDASSSVVEAIIEAALPGTINVSAPIFVYAEYYYYSFANISHNYCTYFSSETTCIYPFRNMFVCILLLLNVCSS